MAEYVEIIHNGEEISWSEFISVNLIKTDSNFTSNALFSYEGNDTRILLNYLPEEKQQYNNRASTSLIKSGTLIRIPVQNIDKEVIAVQSSTVVANDNYKAFIGEQIKKIISNSQYNPINRSEVDSRFNKVYKVYDNFNVWVWSKALGESLGDGKIIDITPFIQSINVTVGDNGGNFQLTLAPVLGEFIEREVAQYDYLESLKDVGFTGEYVKKGSWVINRGSAVEYAYLGRKNILVRDSVYRATTDLLVKNKVLFHNILQSNDVVFIQFEELEIEGDKRNRHIGELGLDNLIIDNQQLPGRFFDMIGLIDTNTLVNNSITSDLSVNITGRDLMKLLIEDGEYFYTADFAGGTAGVTVDNINSGNNDTNRPIKRLVDGNLNFFNAYVDRTIEYSLKFILNMLSNIEICNDKLFKYYTDKVTRYEYSDVKDVETNAIPGGANLSIPASANQVDTAGIWQIIKLIIDERLANRRIVDSSIVSDQGSLINFIQGKVAHKPFAEFFGDTYGDKYFLIARVPPFSQESFIDNKRYAIDVDPSVVMTESLTYDDGEVFSWYRIIPKGNFFGDDSSIALTYFPAIFFEEYAKIWGSRPLIQVSNYIDYQGIKDERGKIRTDYLIDQARQDLAYLIETNAYRPFTRKGQITLGIGDRRIKRGQCIRLKSTGEIYHVDSVTNTGTISENSVDRGMVISVSRGMVEKYMEGDINYFNIVNLDKDSRGRSKSSNFRVNRDIFHFFIQKQQFKL